MNITEDAPIEVAVYRSKIDGALVVEIDTTDETGNLRVNLNGGLIWTGDPQETTGYRDLLRKIKVEERRSHQPFADDQTRATNNAEFRGYVNALLYPVEGLDEPQSATFGPGE